MIWTIAAAPLWVLGFAFLYGGFACLADKRPGETSGDILLQFALAMVLSLAFLYLAARMSS